MEYFTGMLSTGRKNRGATLYKSGRNSLEWNWIRVSIIRVRLFQSNKDTVLKIAATRFDNISGHVTGVHRCHVKVSCYVIKGPGTVIIAALLERLSTNNYWYRDEKGSGWLIIVFGFHASVTINIWMLAILKARLTRIFTRLRFVLSACTPFTVNFAYGCSEQLLPRPRIVGNLWEKSCKKFLRKYEFSFSSRWHPFKLIRSSLLRHCARLIYRRRSMKDFRKLHYVRNELDRTKVFVASNKDGEMLSRFCNYISTWIITLNTLLFLGRSASDVIRSIQTANRETIIAWH